MQQGPIRMYVPDRTVKFLSVLAAALQNISGKVYWLWDARGAIAMRSIFITAPTFICRIIFSWMSFASLH